MPRLTIDIEARFAQFQDSLNQLNSTASQVSGRLEQSFGAVSRVFAGLTAAVGAIGFGRMIKNTIDAGDELNKLSQKTGIAAERLSELGFAARLSDVTTEGLSTGLRQLAKSIDESAKGFDRIGVSTRTADGTLRGTDDVLLDVAESFSKLADGAGKSALAQELFGRSGADLIPLLNQGRAGLQAYADEARRAGLVLSGETAKAAEEFNDNITRLRAGLEGLQTQFSAQLIGPLAKVTTSLLDASRAAGSLGEGLARALLGQGRNLPDELQRVEVRIAAIRAERDRLKGTLGDSALARSIPFLSRNKDLEEEERKLRVQRDFLVSLKEIRDERTRQEQEANRPKTAIKAVEDEPKKKKSTRDDELQRQINASREIGRLTAEEAKNRAEIAEAYSRIDLESQAERDRKALEDATRAAGELQSLLASTPSGQLAELERRQLLVNEAFVAGKITVDQFNEAFAVLDSSRNEVLGRSQADFQKISDDGRKAFKDLEFAVQGWGRQFTTTLANAVRTGKFDFQSLVDTVIQGLLEMQIQLAITAPLFKSIQGALGGFFGAPAASGSAPATFGAKGLAVGGSGLMAFARGGVVDRPTMFGFGGGRLGVMGESGAEAILPLKRGAGGRLGVELTGQRGGGGVTVNQNITFNGGTDPAQQAAFARQIKAETLSAVVDAIRRGDGNFAPRGA